MQKGLFEEKQLVNQTVTKPIFEHSYLVETTFLGSHEGHDLYFGIVNGVPHLLDRHGNGNFQFEGETVSEIVNKKYNIDTDSYFGKAYSLAKEKKLICDKNQN